MTTNEMSAEETKKVGSPDTENQEADCAICYEPLLAAIEKKQQQRAPFVCACKHGFHATCLRRWVHTVGKDASCPLCRAPLGASQLAALERRFRDERPAGAAIPAEEEQKVTLQSLLQLPGVRLSDRRTLVLDLAHDGWIDALRDLLILLRVRQLTPRGNNYSNGPAITKVDFAVGGHPIAFQIPWATCFESRPVRGEPERLPGTLAPSPTIWMPLGQDAALQQRLQRLDRVLSDYVQAQLPTLQLRPALSSSSSRSRPAAAAPFRGIVRTIERSGHRDEARSSSSVYLKTDRNLAIFRGGDRVQATFGELTQRAGRVECRLIVRPELVQIDSGSAAWTTLRLTTMALEARELPSLRNPFLQPLDSPAPASPAPLAPPAPVPRYPAAASSSSSSASSNTSDAPSF